MVPQVVGPDRGRIGVEALGLLDQVEPASAGREGVEAPLAVELDRVAEGHGAGVDDREAGVTAGIGPRDPGEDQGGAVGRDPRGRTVVGHYRDAPAAVDDGGAKHTAAAGLGLGEDGPGRKGDGGESMIAGVIEDALGAGVQRGGGKPARMRWGCCDEENGEQ